MPETSDPTQFLERLDLKEYEATALTHLLELGRTTAPTLAEATGIPKARIYDVLDSLANAGYVKAIPGRPKRYQPESPEKILDRAEENYRQEFESRKQELESLSDEFLDTFQPLYEQAGADITPTEELFWVLDVGEPSETETRTLYREAEDHICVITKSFEYLEDVEPAIQDALARGVPIDALFLHPDHLSSENREVQTNIVASVRSEYPAISIRFSNEQLPWRGTLIDPSMEYVTGKAIFLVEEKDVPLHLRQAAVTDNGSFVAGLKRYFDLIWEYDSVEEYPGGD